MHRRTFLLLPFLARTLGLQQNSDELTVLSEDGLNKFSEFVKHDGIAHDFVAVNWRGRPSNRFQRSDTLPEFLSIYNNNPGHYHEIVLNAGGDLAFFELMEMNGLEFLVNIDSDLVEHGALIHATKIPNPAIDSKIFALMRYVNYDLDDVNARYSHASDGRPKPHSPYSLATLVKNGDGTGSYSTFFYSLYERSVLRYKQADGKISKSPLFLNDLYVEITRGSDWCNIVYKPDYAMANGQFSKDTLLGKHILRTFTRQELENIAGKGHVPTIVDWAFEKEDTIELALLRQKIKLPSGPGSPKGFVESQMYVRKEYVTENYTNLTFSWLEIRKIDGKTVLSAGQ